MDRMKIHFFIWKTRNIYYISLRISFMWEARIFLCQNNQKTWRKINEMETGLIESFKDLLKEIECLVKWTLLNVNIWVYSREKCSISNELFPTKLYWFFEELGILISWMKILLYLS